MVSEGHWTWTSPDPGLPGIPGIPLTNYVGWVITAVIIMTLMSRLPQRKPVGIDGVPTLMLAWVYFSNVLANAIFFDRPWVAVWGGVIMGAVVIPWAWITWTRRP
jgi:putative membrane protein